MFKHQLQLEIVRSTNRYLEFILDKRTQASAKNDLQVNGLSSSMAMLKAILLQFKNPLLAESFSVLEDQRHVISMVVNINQILFKVSYLISSLEVKISNVNDIIELTDDESREMAEGYASLLQQLAAIIKELQREDG